MGYPTYPKPPAPLTPVLVTLSSAACVALPEGVTLQEPEADSAPTTFEVWTSTLEVHSGGVLYFTVGQAQTPVFLAPGTWSSAAGRAA